jgi:DNA-binding CsgD family transcriptional regulator
VDTTIPTLTPREREVLTLLAYGHTNDEVAEHLTISVRTAEMHRANAMRKLRVRSRAEIVRWALDEQLLA